MQHHLFVRLFNLNHCILFIWKAHTTYSYRACVFCIVRAPPHSYARANHQSWIIPYAYI